MIFSDDRKRKCANPPAMLRQRMLERSMDSEPETDQASDHDILLALHRMNESDRRAALQLLPTSALMHDSLWQALQEMSDAEIARLYGEMNE